MNRNANSHFSYNPTNIDIGRSRFKRDSSVKLTGNVGELIPFYVDEVLPGDTFNITSSKIIRLQTLLTPMMDNLYADFYWFFIPNRLTWTHWKEFMGENTTSAWAPQIEYTLPKLYSTHNYDVDDWKDSVADYLGIPCIGKDPEAVDNGLYFNALPFRAYGLVYNEFFRSEALCDPDNVYLGDNNLSLDLDDSDRDDKIGYRGYPFKVAKYFDYFTSCLPAPQKGPSVLLPLSGLAPVVTGDNHTDILSATTPAQGIRFGNTDGSGINYESGSGNYVASRLMTDLSTNFAEGSLTASNVSASQTENQLSAVLPYNLFTDLSEIAGNMTINELRTAFQIQKLLEKDARGGSRYIEILKSHFGVTSPDYRLQRPEYLGGNRVPININQVIQQSETSASSPMGNTAAMSVTSDIHGDFTKSFTEHGIILGLVVLRYDHTYQQGLERFWSRDTRYDYFWPVLANIGEQAVKVSEIYATGTQADNDVFGYNEAWADYRYKPSRVAGEMRSKYTTSLDVWHLADDYASQPYLSAEWIQEDHKNVDRVLAVTSNVSDQFFADIYVKNITTRAMPLYSIPGLIDHH